MELNKKVADFTLHKPIEDKTVSLSDYGRASPSSSSFNPGQTLLAAPLRPAASAIPSRKLQAAGAVVLGISRDTPGSGKIPRQSSTCLTHFLADVDEKVCNQFGVLKEKNM